MLKGAEQTAVPKTPVATPTLASELSGKGESVDGPAGKRVADQGRDA